MSPWWLYPIAGAFILSLLLTELVRDLALRWGVVDVPSKPRKLHKEPMPLMGGAAIYFAFTIAVIPVLLLTDHFTAGDINDIHFVGLLLGGWILIIGGILDDMYELPPQQSVLFPLLACLVAVASGIGVSKVTNPFGDPFEISHSLSAVISFVWLMAIIYTTKLLDGLDGLATGVASIGSFMIALLALSVAYFQPDVALLALIACAAMLGFLVWNMNPATIFLGEGGSTFVGFLLGVLAIISGSKIATALLVVGIPALDVVFVAFERWKLGKPIFHGGDRRHLHHKLLASGFSQRQVVFFYWLIATAFGATTLIFASWQKLLALSVLFVMMLVFAKLFSSKVAYES